MFYKQPEYYKYKFNLIVEISYEDFNADELQSFLNEAVVNEKWVFRTCLTIYQSATRGTDARRSTAPR